MNFWLLLVSRLVAEETVVSNVCSSILLSLLTQMVDIKPVTYLESLCFVCKGFDLCEVGQEEVVLKTGKLANRRTLHFALQSLLALFGKYCSSLNFYFQLLYYIIFYLFHCPNFIILIIIILNVQMLYFFHF